LARISTYATDGTIVDGDKVIGSDANNDLITKNYRVGDLVAYFAVAIGDYLVPYQNATEDVNLGFFDLYANNVRISNRFIVNGDAGLPGQVLMSQGSSYPAAWAYVTGTQTLQNVLNQGNVGDKSIILENSGNKFVADIDGVYDSSANVYIKDKSTGDIGQFYVNKVSLSDSSLSRSSEYESDSIVYTESVFGNTVTVRPTSYNNQTFLYPNVGGAFVMSVNGVFADFSGNIVLPSASGTVTSVGVSAGTGISASVSNPTTTPVISISNTAPDQTVVLNNGTGINVTGSYPNFTISATGGSTSNLQQVVNVGNGISNFGGIGNASIQSTNFTNNRTLYLNDNSYPAIRLVDNANASNFLQIDVDTLNVDGVSYNWSSIVNPSIGPLLALPFTTDHITATNNPYLIGDVVWYLGNVYRCIANNDSILPTNASYWTNLGAGYPLVQQPSDWNSTSGNNQILNKPTIPTITPIGFEQNFLLMGA
jgi:hypothetical protein